jgi:hypothetical protein
LIAIFLYFSANQEVVRLAREGRADHLPGHDFAHDRTRPQGPLEPHDGGAQAGLLARWREQRRQARESARRQQELAEEARMDAILVRLFETEIENLSAEDRALLERVSARYRSRARQGDTAIR